MSESAPRSPKAGLLINEISKLFHNKMRKNSDELGFKTGYRQVLRFLAHEDGVTQVDIARDAHFTAPTVSVTLKKMEEEGIVSRRRDEKDARAVRIYLTDNGRSIDSEHIKSIKSVDSEALRGLTDEEQKMLMALLTKIRNNLIYANENESEADN